MKVKEIAQSLTKCSLTRKPGALAKYDLIQAQYDLWQPPDERTLPIIDAPHNNGSGELMMRQNIIGLD